MSTENRTTKMTINVKVNIVVPDGTEDEVRMRICELLDRKHSPEFQIEDWESD